jgi:hypothetical protein
MSIETAQSRFTAEELLADAARAGHPEVTRRLITDWVALGLLDKAQARGRGKGKGKDYSWPREQRNLMRTLLVHHGTVRRPILCNVPVGIWLMFGDDYVPLRQVRRALATWAAAYGKVNFTNAKSGAEQALLQLDHPDAADHDRDRLRQLLTQAGKKGSVDLQALTDAARRVVDPHGTGIARGPLGLLNADGYVGIIAARVEGMHAIKTAEDGTYWGARRMYLSTNPTSPELRGVFENQPRIANPRMLGPQALGFEAAVNNACLDLITLLGINRLNSPTTPGFNTRQGPDRPRWQPPRSKLKKK